MTHDPMQEANEAALKLARKFGHDKGITRPEVVVFEGAFHGRSIATLSATANPKIHAGFGPLVEAGLTATDSFAAAVGMSAEQLAQLAIAQPAQYDALLSQAYPPFFNQFAFAAQSVIDSGDALNYAAPLAATTGALHLLEVVGNDADNPADRVIPNRTSPEQLYARLQNLQLPLVGTEPLIQLLGLPAVTTSTGAPFFGSNKLSNSTKRWPCNLFRTMLMCSRTDSSSREMV